MRKRSTWIISLVVVATFMLAAPVLAAPTVQLDGRQLTFEVPPMIENGRTLVPLRAIFEAMGATVAWDDASKRATAVKGTTTVILQIGSTEATINGQVKYLSVPAKVVNGRTLAPLRFVGEAFGGTVLWDPETQLISLISTSDPALIGLSKLNPVPRSIAHLTKQGIEIKVNYMVEDGSAWSILEQANSTNPRPEREMKYVIVSYTVKNVSSPKQPQYVSYADFRLTGSSNIIFDPYDKNIALPTAGSLSTFREYLNHGDVASGAATYYVPKLEKNMLLIWGPTANDIIYFGLN